MPQAGLLNSRVGAQAGCSTLADNAARFNQVVALGNVKVQINILFNQQDSHNQRTNKQRRRFPGA
jgi:hypothetical protein